MDVYLGVLYKYEIDFDKYAKFTTMVINEIIICQKVCTKD